MGSIDEITINRLAKQTLFNSENLIVFRVNYRHEDLVVKKMRIDQNNFHYDTNSFIAQIHAFGLLRHDSIARIRGQYFEGAGIWFCIVMNYYRNLDLGKELNDRINNQNHWKNKDLYKIFIGLIDGFAHLQSKNIVHGNINPKIVLRDGSRYFITALEYAYRRSDMNCRINNEYIRSNPIYMSPIVSNVHHNHITGTGAMHNPYKSDVYSLGLVFLSMTKLMEIQSDVNGFDRNRFSRFSAIAESITNDRIKGIITRMLKYDEAERPTFISLAGSLGIHILANNNERFLLSDNNQVNDTIQSWYKICIYCNEITDNNFVIYENRHIHLKCFVLSFNLVNQSDSQTVYLKRNFGNDEEFILIKEILNCKKCGNKTYSKNYINPPLCLGCLRDDNVFGKLERNCVEIFEIAYCQKCLRPAEIKFNRMKHYCCFICALKIFRNETNIKCPWDCCKIE